MQLMTIYLVKQSCRSTNLHPELKNFNPRITMQVFSRKVKMEVEINSIILQHIVAAINY